MHFLLQIDNVSAIGSMASASSTVTHALPLRQFEYIVYISDILQVFVFFILYFTIFMPANCRSCVYRWILSYFNRLKPTSLQSLWLRYVH